MALTIGPTTAANAIGHKVADTVVACIMASPALDSPFPLIMAIHTNQIRKLYDKLNIAEAAVVAQPRTLRSGLNGSLHNIRRVYLPRCVCGRGVETAKHVLLECTRWSKQRAELRRAVGNRFNDMSYMLGG